MLGHDFVFVSARPRVEPPILWIGTTGGRGPGGHGGGRAGGEGFASRLRSELHGKEITIGQIGCVLGTHTGPKALGVVYIKK